MSYQLVVYAGRDSRGRDEHVRRTLTGVSRREATKAHAQLLIDVEHGRTGPSRSLTPADVAGRTCTDAEGTEMESSLTGAGANARRGELAGVAVECD